MMGNRENSKHNGKDKEGKSNRSTKEEKRYEQEKQREK